MPYPDGNDSFPQQLQGVAAMIAAGLPLRCVALDATGSYDTHAGQTAALTPALTTTAASLFAFQRDLEARGVADRVLTLVWSEFGRRAQENGSGGTDHGAAGTAFLIGTRAAGTQVGEFPASRRASTRTATSSRRPTSAASTPRCSSSGCTSTPRGSSRTRRSSSGRSSSSEGSWSSRLGALRARRRRSRAGAGRCARVLVPALADAAEVGPGVIELANFGQDSHDLRVQRVGARHIAGTQVVQAGGRTELTVTLRPGATASGARSQITAHAA